MGLQNLKISQKLTISYLLLGIFSVALISFIFYGAFKKALIDRTSEQLYSVNVLKKAQIEDYFRSRKIIFEIFLHNKEIIQAVASAYVNENDLEHLNQLQKDFKYNELIILDSSFKIIYPQKNKHDFLYDLLQNKEKNIAFKNFLREGLKKYTRKDFSNEISDSSLALLVAAPIQNEKNQHIGLALLRKDFAGLEKILFERTGMGNTGESYIIGDDKHMRSRSRFFPEKNPLNIPVETEASHQVFQNSNAFKIIKDYRNEEVLSAFRKLNIDGLHWAIISEIDMKEAIMPIHEVRNYIVICGFIISLLIVIVTLLLSKKISTPILELRDVVLDLSKGILPEMTTQSAKGDEIGEMTKAIASLVEGLKRTSNFASSIGAGNFQANFQPLSSRDSLGDSLIRMRDQLKIMQEREINFIRQRSSVLLEGQEEERRRIARELHDGIGQMLTATKLRIGMIEGQEEIKKEIKEILDETIQEVRRVSYNLMPNVLIDFGLEAALRLLCNNTSDYAETIVDFNFRNSDETKKINFETSISLYRIAQEALNNVVKYSHAKNASVSLELKENKIRMEISDNGIGFDLPEYYQNKKPMNGIKNMKERAELLNGKFTIQSEVGNYTLISIEVPI